MLCTCPDIEPLIVSPTRVASSSTSSAGPLTLLRPMSLLLPKPWKPAAWGTASPAPRPG